MIDKIIEEDLNYLINFAKEKKIEFAGKNILITGGAGFLGSWFCDLFIALGARVVCVDNFSTGKLEFIDHLISNRNFKLIKHDITNGLPQFEDKFDYILHLAARASPDDYMQHPVETALTNALGTYYTLELARKHDAVFLLTSTSEVYGDAKVIPTPESYWGNVNPIGIRACYDEGKRFAEALALSYYREYGLKVRITRIFNTYGPRLRGDGPYGRVISRFLIQAIRGEPLTVHGDGKQTRSFTYVRDTIEAHLLILSNEKCNGVVLNVGNDKEITILELAKLILKITGCKSRIIFTKPREDDPRRRCPDLSKIKKLLGWYPKVELKLGLKRTYEWLKSFMK